MRARHAYYPVWHSRQRQQLVPARYMALGRDCRWRRGGCDQHVNNYTTWSPVRITCNGALRGAANEFALVRVAVAPNWDGLYTDNFLPDSAGSGDYTQSGTEQSISVATPTFQAGYAAYVPLLLTALGAGKQVWGNLANWRSPIPSGYNQLLTGGDYGGDYRRQLVARDDGLDGDDGVYKASWRL